MDDWVNGINWGSFVISGVGGYFAGFFYYRNQMSRACLAGTLFVLHKLSVRGVFLSTYDRAVIKVAVDHLMTTK